MSDNICKYENCTKKVYCRGICRSHYRDEMGYREKEKQYTRKWREENPDAHKNWDSASKERVRKRVRKWRSKNPEKSKVAVENWRKENREIYLESNRRSQKKKRENQSLQQRLADNLRKRLHQAVKNDYRSGSAVNDLGCSIEFFKEYMETLFTDGMSWENYGRSGWHIDHIEPISNFDLSDSEQLKKACNYKNLQPLWAKDNIRKSNN